MTLKWGGRPWALVSWLASAVMIGLAIWHLLHGATALGEWRRWRTTDPSLADFYWTELEVELVFTIGFLVVALLFAAAAKRLQKRPDEITKACHPNRQRR